MRTFSSRLACAAIGLAFALSMAGCAERAPVAAGGPPQGAVIVQQAPPVEIVEAVPPAPGPGWVWVRGHWQWNGWKYRWARGHWARPPGGYTVWVAPRWQARAGGWFFIRGHWQ